jgi:hypothetical protein
MQTKSLIPLAIAAALVAPVPAFADETTLRLVAKIVGGLAQDSVLLIGDLGTGTVNELEPGAYEIGYDTGVSAATFAEPEPCVFTLHARMVGLPGLEQRFDFNAITGIDVVPQESWDGLNVVVVTLQGPDTAVQVRDGDGWMPGPPFANVVSSITVDELRAAAIALREACPGP